MDRSPISAPLVDIGGIRGGDRDDTVASAIHRACVETGFFVVTGHGLEREIDEVFRVARAFFARSQAEKEQIPRIDRYGYVPHADRAIDTSRTSGHTEYLDLGLHDEVPMPSVRGFADAVGAYQDRAIDVAGDLLAVMAESIGAGASFFRERMHDPQCRLRMLHYFAADREGDRALPIPTRAHTDYGAITLLATDGVPGLEVEGLDGGWAPVEAPAGSLVVNLGDMLARWSNDRYRSTPHRVVGPVGRERFSIPLFVNPDPSTVVECIPACVSEDRPQRYGPVTAGDFLAGRIDGTIDPARHRLDAGIGR